MHAVVKIISFLIVAVFCAGGQTLHLITLAALIGILYFAYGRQYLKTLWIAVKRMRWFLSSIIVLYFWFTPGQPLPLAVPPKLQFLLPTGSGINEALTHVGALIIIVATAHLLIKSTARHELLSAIYFLVSPLSIIKFPSERFALRMSLVMDIVGDMRAVTEGAVQANTTGKPLSRLSSAITTSVEQALNNAKRAPCVTFVIPHDNSPALKEWMYPVILIMVLSLLGMA